MFVFMYIACIYVTNNNVYIITGTACVESCCLIKALVYMFTCLLIYVGLESRSYL